MGAALLIGLLGINRTMGFWGYFFGSLVLTPVVGVLLLLVSGSRTKPKIDDKKSR
jgi:uncharacterized membrane protein